MRLPLEPSSNTAKRELSDADRARIDARMARFGVAQEFAEAGLIIGEDYRKVTQLYEQLSAQARDRGESLPAIDVWLQQRAQERLGQGYRPTIPERRVAQPFEAAMSEAAGVARAPTAAAAGERGEPSANASRPLPGPADVEGLLGQLALGQQSRVGAVPVAVDAVASEWLADGTVSAESAALARAEGDDATDAGGRPRADQG